MPKQVRALGHGRVRWVGSAILDLGGRSPDFSVQLSNLFDEVVEPRGFILVEEAVLDRVAKVGAEGMEIGHDAPLPLSEEAVVLSQIPGEFGGLLFQCAQLSLGGANGVVLSVRVFKGLEEGIDVYQVDGVLFDVRLYVGEGVYFQQGGIEGETELFVAEERVGNMDLWRSWAVTSIRTSWVPSNFLGSEILAMGPLMSCLLRSSRGRGWRGA